MKRHVCFLYKPATSKFNSLTDLIRIVEQRMEANANNKRNIGNQEGHIIMQQFWKKNPSCLAIILFSCNWFLLGWEWWAFASRTAYSSIAVSELSWLSVNSLFTRCPWRYRQKAGSAGPWEPAMLKADDRRGLTEARLTEARFTEATCGLSCARFRALVRPKRAQDSSGVPREGGGAEGAIRPGRHSERGGKKKKKKKRKKGEREKGKKGKRNKRKKRKIWEKHVITVKLKWNLSAAAPLCT